ncbi:DUF302 domain-containing protein [Geobacter pelophilus]|jgi:uncharacterized protein (DUF302 family)|uniref:DUF302 domain-containing protein n=1 Tax=Geoanaerobacter pelophilus TaxID=60036 RepID=A0AAW4LEL2_9BACT|nr:DUF302 domain-containing protein [Geoanaerobacter pelophilus]MBT0666444.1 DUF302 domain-containing protein [Geoanaerobacter pelophilus]
MQWAELYQKETDKPLIQFVADLKSAAGSRGFSIHNESGMNMANSFGAHGVEVAQWFDLHMIQICKPEKAAASLQANPERAPLMPKFVMIFSRDGRTQVRFLVYNRPMIETLVGDPAFADSLAESYAAIKTMIEAAL